MQTYAREGDGAEMVWFSSGCWVNRKAGENIGIIMRSRAVRPKDPPKVIVPPPELIKAPKNLKPQRIRRSRAKSMVAVYASVKYYADWLDDQETAAQQILLTRAALMPTINPLIEIGDYYDKLAAAE